MTPLTNALGAALYIIGIVFVMSTFVDNATVEGTLLMPIAMLSLFVLSAAVMGFLFLARPLELYFDNHKKEAFSFFLKTLGTFACFVVIYLVGLFMLLR